MLSPRKYNAHLYAALAVILFTYVIFLRLKWEELLSENRQLAVAVTDMIRTYNETAQANEQLLRGGFHEPSLEYEQNRRAIQRDLDEMFRFGDNHLKEVMDVVKKCAPTDKADCLSRITKGITSIQMQFRDRYLVLRARADMLATTDGYMNWRQREKAELDALISKRILDLQSQARPEECTATDARSSNPKSTPFLTCKLNKACGFGCQVHHVLYCLLTAYGTSRQMVLNSRGWRYNSGGFDMHFKPISPVCDSHFIPPDGVILEPNVPKNVNVKVSIVEQARVKTFLPPALPADIASRLEKLLNYPIVWWAGQFVDYILRPAPRLEKLLAEQMALMTSKAPWSLTSSPWAAVHIRRTDKVGSEAAFHSIHEYMNQVEIYFDLVDTKLALKYGQAGQEAPKLPRYVYVATDDSKVLSELRSSYGSTYTFIGNSSISSSAKVRNRYNSRSLDGVMVDMYMLSRASFIVCTFSSQVCRVAHEMQQSVTDDDIAGRSIVIRSPDRSADFASLDDLWYYGGGHAHHQIAILPSGETSELEIKPGDLIGVAGNHWNGFNKGHNMRTNQIGLYPVYKTAEKMHTESQFPSTYGPIAG